MDAYFVPKVKAIQDAFLTIFPNAKLVDGVDGDPNIIGTCDPFGLNEVRLLMAAVVHLRWQVSCEENMIDDLYYLEWDEQDEGTWMAVYLEIDGAIGINFFF